MEKSEAKLLVVVLKREKEKEEDLRTDNLELPND